MKDNDFYKEGFHICLDNSKRLAKIAAIAGHENEYSVACSLNILAGEEAIKAIALIVRHCNPSMEIDGFNKLFLDHRTKHALLIEASEIITPIIEILYTEHGFFNYAFEKLHRLAAQIPEPERRRLLAVGKPFLDLLEQNSQINSDQINCDDAKDWWNGANIEKNKGFYADIENSTWHDPKSFTEGKYQESLKYTNSMIANAERMIDLIERAGHS